MKRAFKAGLVFATLALLLTGCNCYNKMKKKTDMIQTICTPSVLFLQGKEVKATYTVEFPANYFDRKAVLRITPVLVYQGGELAGTPSYVQGVKVRDNYTVIPIGGGNFTATVSFPYNENMRVSTLELRIDAKCTSGSAKRTMFSPFTVINIASGVSTIQELADLSGQTAFAPDNFKRNTVISQDARIMFLINKSDVRASELNSEDIKILERFIVDNSGDPKKSVSNIYTKSYASPEGPRELNERLSRERGRNTEKAVGEKYAKDKAVANPRFDVEALGEDWEGFKALVQSSDIPDKDLIISVLRMYDSPEKRDAEIKNMTAAFEVLKVKILPELRRSKLQVDVSKQGMTDAELRTAVMQNLSSLNVEEMLFAATLFNDKAEKMKIYKAAIDKYNDYRAMNNYACLLLQEGKASEAAASLNAAARLNNSSNEVINNLGLAALMTGNYAEARRYFSSINTTESKYNLGLLNMMEGNYTEAVKSLDGYNLAVAQVLSGNFNTARMLLATENSANADYLKAIISAKEGNSVGVVTNLRSAVGKNPALKARAKTDVEFAKWFSDSEFKSVVG